MQAQGTIVGEGVSLAHQTPGVSLTQHNHTTNSSRHPLAALSFPDHTILRTDDESMKSVSTKPSWSIYQSPEKEPKADLIPSVVPERDDHRDAADILLPKRSFHRKSEKKPLVNQDVAPGFSWLQVNASVHTAESGLDVTTSPHWTSGEHQNTKPMWTIYKSPERAPETDFLWAKSPEPMAEQDLDVLSAQEEVHFLLSKKSFQQRRSGTEAVRMLHESLLRSPKAVSEPAPEEPMSPAPGLDWLCTASPPRPTENDLDVMASPRQCSGKLSEATPASPEKMTVSAADVPMSPGAADTATSGINDITPDTRHW